MSPGPLVKFFKSLPPVALASLAMAEGRERFAPFEPLRTFLPPRRIERVRRAGLLFIHIPRNSGTSIAEAIYGRAMGHHSVRYYRRFPAAREGVTSFAVLRDPLQRFLSSYRFVVQRGAGDISLNSYWAMRTRHVRTLAHYLDFLLAQRSRLDSLDFVMRSQAWFICDSAGQVAVDALFMLEGDPRLAGFLARHGAPPLTRRNTTVTSATELTAAQAETVRSLYAADFAIVARIRDEVSGGSI